MRRLGGKIKVVNLNDPSGNPFRRRGNDRPSIVTERLKVSILFLRKHLLFRRTAAITTRPPLPDSLRNTDHYGHSKEHSANRNDCHQG
jgi:hypothetical protein